MKKYTKVRVINTIGGFFFFSCFTITNLRSVFAWDFDEGFIPDFGSGWWRDPRQFIYQIIPSNTDWGVIAGWFFLALLVIVGTILLIVYMLRKPSQPLPPPYYPQAPMMMTPPPPPAFMGPTLLVTHANGIRQSVPMSYDRMMIGRNPGSQIPIQDFKVSDQHAEVFVQGGRYFVRDLGSANGTLINGYLVNGTVEIFSGSIIQVGDSTIQM